MSNADSCMGQAALLATWRGPVSADWVDYNGHLRDAFYLLIFSYATDALMDRIGLDASGRKSTGHSLFTLEAHINYVQEVSSGAMVEVRTQLLGHDSKRLQVYHSLHQDGVQALLAANEQMLLNVDLTERAGPRSAPFAPTVLERLEAIRVVHQALPKPKYAGRSIALPALQSDAT